MRAARCGDKWKCSGRDDGHCRTLGTCGAPGKRACVGSPSCDAPAVYDPASARCQEPGKCPGRNDGNCFTLGPCGGHGQRACASGAQCTAPARYDAASAKCQESGRCPGRNDGNCFTVGPCGDDGQRVCTSAPNCSPPNWFDAAKARCSGAPKPKGDCPEGFEQWGGACYEPCREGFKVYDRLGGDRCYPGCPPKGYRDDGTHCAKVGAKTCPEHTDDHGITCMKKAQFRKTKVTEGARKAGEAIVKGLEVVGESLCGPPCLIKRIVDTMGNETRRNEWVDKLQGAMRGLADSFKQILIKFEPSNAQAEARDFFFKTQSALETLMAQIEDVFLPRFFGLEVLIRKAISTTISGTTLPVVLLLGSVHYGVKQFLKWLIPELIFLSGNAFKEIEKQPLLKMIFDILKAFTGPIMGLFKQILQPDKVKKLQEGIEKALDITAKIEDAAKRAIAAATSGGDPGATLDGALDPGFLKSPEVVGRVVEELSKFARAEIRHALRAPFTKLLNLLLSALNKVLDIPRNALVASVGSIPFVGGILAGSLNFLLGLIVEKINELIGDFLMDFAETSVDDTLGEIFEALKKKVTGKGPAAEKNRVAFDAFLNMVQTVLGSLTDKLKAARDGLKNSLGKTIASGVAAVGGTILKQVVTQLNIGDPDAKQLVLELIHRAQGAATTFSATPVVVKDVVRTIASIGAPVGAFVIKKIPAEPAVRRLLSRAHDGLVSALEDITTIKDDPTKVLAGAAEIAGGFLKEKVGDALRDSALGPERDVVTRGIDMFVSLLANPDERQKLVSSGAAGNAVLGKLADLAQPYLRERLTALVQGTGLERLVALAADALAGGEGMLRKGAAFFAGLRATFARDGQRMGSELLGALGDFLGRQVENGTSGRVSGALVRGLVGALANKLAAPGQKGFAGAGAEAVLSMAKDAFTPLLEVIAPAVGGARLASVAGFAAGPGAVFARAVAAQAVPSAAALLRPFAGGVLDAFANPDRLKTGAREVVTQLATAAARGLKDLVSGTVLGLPMDNGLRPFVESALAGFLDLLSNPRELGKYQGKQALLVLQKGAQVLFPHLKAKVITGLPAPAQALVGALFDAIIGFMHSPATLDRILAGTAADFLARAADALGLPIVKLLATGVPGPVRAPLEALGAKIIANLKAPRALAAQTAAGLARSVIEEGKLLLKAVLATVTDAPAAAIDAALAQLTQAATRGASARKAIDQTLVPLLLQVTAAAPRELALGVVGVLRELASSAKLRADANALWRRIADVGVRFVQGLAPDVIPGGELRELVIAAARAVRKVFTVAQGGVRAGLTRPAKEFLPHVAWRIGLYLQEVVRTRIPHPIVSAFVGGLVQQGWSTITDAARWKALAQEGLGALLRGLAPVGSRFILAGAAKSGRVTGEVRTFLEAFVRALANVIGDPKQGAAVAANPASAIVRAGLRALKQLLKDAVDRAGASAPLRNTLDRIVENGIAILLDDKARAAFFKLSAPGAFTAAGTEAKRLIHAALAASAVPPELRKLGTGWLAAMETFAQRLIAAPGDVATALQNALGKGVVPALAGFIRARAEKALAGAGLPQGVLRALTGAFNELTTFAAQGIADPNAVSARGSAPKVLRAALDWMLSFVRPAIERAIPVPALRSFVVGLVDSIRDVLTDPDALVAALKGGAASALGLFLPKLAGLLDGLIQNEVLAKLLQNAGVFRELVRILAHECLDLLRNPTKLLALVDDLRAGAASWKGSLMPKLKGLVLNLVDAFKAALPPALVDGMKTGVGLVFDAVAR